MADKRFAEDTVFVIFEGDYTLLQSDEQARVEWEAAQDNIGLQLRATYELAAALPETKKQRVQKLLPSVARSRPFRQAGPHIPALARVATKRCNSHA